MQKYPRGTSFGGLFKVFIAAELTAVVSSYFVWNRMNSSRPFRKQMRDNFPSILDGYYTLGEKLDSTNNIRERDSAVWAMDFETKQ